MTDINMLPLLNEVLLVVMRAFQSFNVWLEQVELLLRPDNLIPLREEKISWIKI